VPDIPGRELGITSNEAFNLEQLPHSVLLVGGGFIAVEFATIFHGLGVPTTICYRGDRLLRGFDEDIRTGLEAGLVERGIRIIHETNVSELRQVGADTIVRFSDGVEAPFGLVMFATGRTANVEGIGL
jgi:glutathione reductase (NADPH)